MPQRTTTNDNDAIAGSYSSSAPIPLPSEFYNQRLQRLPEPPRPSTPPSHLSALVSASLQSSNTRPTSSNVSIVLWDWCLNDYSHLSFYCRNRTYPQHHHPDPPPRYFLITLKCNNSRHWPSKRYLLRCGGFENTKMHDNNSIRRNIKRGLPHLRKSADTPTTQKQNKQFI